MASSLIHHTRAHSTSRAHFHGSSTQALTISSAHFLGHHWPTQAHMMHLGPQPHAGMLAQPYFSVHFLIQAQPYILAYYIIRAHPKSLGVIRLHRAKITQAGREHQYKVTTVCEISTTIPRLCLRECQRTRRTRVGLFKICFGTLLTACSELP